LLELSAGASVGGVVLGGVAAVLVWTVRMTNECRGSAWASAEASLSSQQIVDHMRNAMAVHEVAADGSWIEVRMPADGEVCRFSYEPSSEPRKGGRILFFPETGGTNRPPVVVAKGVFGASRRSEQPLFEVTGPNTVRVAYRVLAREWASARPAQVDIGVHLRNGTEGPCTIP
jgi:hypothetical protein